MVRNRRDQDEERTVITTLPKSSPTKDDSNKDKRREACLVMIYGPDLGRRVTLSPQREFEIGRHPTCAFSIDEDSVSRRHARIVWSNDGWHIFDLNSTNGTYVNGIPVSNKLLSEGDRIKVGRAILKFLSGETIETAYHEEIYRLMTFDGLTGAYNKRYFDEILERELSRGARYQREMALMLFDIDHFKRINDTYGHIAGDAILRELAEVIRTNIRRDDTFCRVGGEEFTIIMPEATLKGAEVAAEKLRQLVENTHFSFEDTHIPVTISIGVTKRKPDDTPTSIYARADENLYKAKNAGRNRVVAL